MRNSQTDSQRTTPGCQHIERQAVKGRWTDSRAKSSKCNTAQGLLKPLGRKLPKCQRISKANHRRSYQPIMVAPLVGSRMTAKCWADVGVRFPESAWDGLPLGDDHFDVLEAVRVHGMTANGSGVCVARSHVWCGHFGSQPHQDGRPPLETGKITASACWRSLQRPSDHFCRAREWAEFDIAFADVHGVPVIAGRLPGRCSDRGMPPAGDHYLFSWRSADFAERARAF